MVAYDITDAESFANIKQWLHEIDKYAGENVNKILIGNKCDLSSKRAVSYEQGKVNYIRKHIFTNFPICTYIFDVFIAPLYRNLQSAWGWISLRHPPKIPQMWIRVL